MERLTLTEHRFCAAADCDVVYFSSETIFEREDVRIPVFQKEPAGGRMVCYCFEISEDRADAAAASRIRAQVQAGRCACELRNPEGRCCLGILWAVGSLKRAEVSQEELAAVRPAAKRGAG